MKRVIKEKMLERYETHLKREEKSKATINKYLCDLRKLMAYAEGKEIDKELVLSYKDIVNAFSFCAIQYFLYLRKTRKAA